MPLSTVSTMTNYELPCSVTQARRVQIKSVLLMLMQA